MRWVVIESGWVIIYEEYYNVKEVGGVFGIDLKGS